MNGLESDLVYRLFFSLGGLALFWVLALIFPFRQSPNFKDPRRIFTNLTFSFGNGLFMKALIPLGLIGLSQNPPLEFQGVLHLSSLKWGGLIGFLILDLALYWQHRLSHKWQGLWRLHRMHHSDLEIDTTSAGRFHPLEILLSFLYKAFWVLLLGIPTHAILIFEIVLNFSSLFNHSNFQLPKPLEKIVSWFLITPNTHRIHHSVFHGEMNKNFGFSTSLWDRIFRSYQSTAKLGQRDMAIGLDTYQDPKQLYFGSLLKQPFLKD